jgi:predicted lipoprotein with Yx(FWY)xxD motif
MRLHSPVVIAMALMAPSVVSGQDGPVPPTTPPGVTLVDVVRELPVSSDQILWTRLGDAEGRTVLRSHADSPGVSRCDATCGVEFPPLLAAAGATPFGDWSVVRRSAGQLQWAYQSSPLHTWSVEQEPGEVATNVGLTETTTLKTAGGLARAGSLLPPDGWDVVRFEPAASLLLPAGIELRVVASAQAVVFADFEGRTLYRSTDDGTGDGPICAEPGCERQWRPVVAPALAGAVGDFSVEVGADGLRQWAYAGRPLYRFEGDALSGDAHGRDLGDQWEIAALSENFRPADVTVTALPAYGDALSVHGMTLYAGSAFEKYWGGRNLRDSFTVAYFRGKRLGSDACSDDGCLATWRPFRAPAGAQSRGFWEVIPRRDGTNQWAYKGFALYTHSGDTAPGQNRGHAIYEFTDPAGQAEALDRVAMLAAIGNAGGGAGVYWNIAKP